MVEFFAYETVGGILPLCLYYEDCPMAALLAHLPKEYGSHIQELEVAFPDAGHQSAITRIVQGVQAQAPALPLLAILQFIKSHQATLLALFTSSVSINDIVQLIIDALSLVPDPTPAPA